MSVDVLDDVAARYATLASLDVDGLTNSWAGQVRSRHGYENERKRAGSVLTDPDLRTKLRKKCDEFGLDRRYQEGPSRSNRL